MSDIQRAVSQAMTARDLINRLQELSEAELDLPVTFTYTGNDYWRTQLAALASDVDTGVIEYSEYHRCPKVIDDEKLETYFDEANEASHEDQEEDHDNEPLSREKLPEHMSSAILISVVRAY